MHDISGKRAAFNKAVHKVAHMREHSPAIVAHINDQSTGSIEILQYIVNITRTKPCLKRSVVHVADIILQQSVIYRSERTVIEIEIVLFYQPGIVVLRIIAPPLAVI